MRVGIIDADLMDSGTRHPNLALMKISGFYKSLNHEVKLIYRSYDEIKEYDRVFISKVFKFTKIPNWVIKVKNVHIGGTGFFEDGGDSLPDEIEHHMPDYDLYSIYIQEMVAAGKKREYYEDYLEYSIGFLTRGCFRKCSFCVNKKYDHVFRHSPVEEFLDNTRPKIYLWDDNFLAYSKWEECLDSLERTGKPFQFRQGIDLRLMDERKAYRFNNTKWCGDFIFAFDYLKDKKEICEKIQLWKKYTNKHPKLYVLCGYLSQDEKDIEDVFERIRILMLYGCIPYIMRHEEYKKSKYKGMYIQIARWCNQPQFYKKMSFREFCERNQFYHPNKKTYCSAYKSMIEFENDFPVIAQKYFDIKYMYESIYEKNYGVGHRYHNKPECRACKLKQNTWDGIVEGKVNKKDAIQQYLEREIDLQCLNYKNSECTKNTDECADYMFSILLNTSYQECEYAVSTYEDNQKLLPEECIAPSMSSYEIDEYLNYITNHSLEGELKTNLLFEKMKINSSREMTIAKRKLLNMAIMDLIYYSNSTKNSTIVISKIGKLYIEQSDVIKQEISHKLGYRFPLVQKYYQCGKDINLLIEDLKYCKKINREIEELMEFVKYESYI